MSGNPRIDEEQPPASTSLAFDRLSPAKASTTPLSNAERQARWRARRQVRQNATAGIEHPRQHRRKITDKRSRPRRWRDAVSELLTLQAEYAAWLEALPDSLQDTATAEALQAIVELDLDTLASAEPPRGYGRD